MLAVGNQNRNEGEKRHGVGPPGNEAERLDLVRPQRAEHGSHRRRHRHGLGRSLASKGDGRAVHPEKAEHVHGDEDEDGVGLQAFPLRIGGRQGSAHEGRADGHKGCQGRQVAEPHEGEMNGRGEPLQAQGGEDAGEHEFDVGGQEDHERPEDDQVVHAEGAGHDPLLGEGVEEHLPESPQEVHPAPVGAPQGNEPEPAVHAPAEYNEGGDQDRRKQSGIGLHA